LLGVFFCFFVCSRHHNIDSMADGPRSQHELRAFASMVVASLPFPPLPVMVLQGEDNTDGIASSFDLLQTAVINWRLGLRPKADEEKIARSKKATLELLQRNMAALYIKTDWKNLTDDWSAVNSAYEIYCAIFRTYLLDHYGACTSDLRFYPLAAVAPDSLIVQQGSSHWKASRLSNDVKCNACGKDHFGSYSDMIRAYALDLATLSG